MKCQLEGVFGSRRPTAYKTVLHKNLLKLNYALTMEQGHTLALNLHIWNGYPFPTFF